MASNRDKASRTGATKRKDALANRQSLLKAASGIFAKEGYRNASVRQICQAAGLNIGAINQHFGNKESLYRTVLVDAGRSLLANQAVPRVEDFENPEDALHAWMHFHLCLVLLRRDEIPVAGALLTREFQNPTPALDELINTILRPAREELSRIISMIINENAKSMKVTRAANFVHGICAFQAIGAPVLEHFGEPKPKNEAAITRRLNSLYPRVLAGLRHP